MAIVDYDEPLLEELRRVYGASLRVFIESLARPPQRYYVRVNTVKADPTDVLDEIRGMGFEAYLDEVVEEAVWMPVKGPYKLSSTADCTIVVDKRAAESIMLGAHVYAPGVIGVEGNCGTGSRALVLSENGVAVSEAIIEKPESLEDGRGLYARNVKPLYRVPSFRDSRLYVEGMIYEQSLPSMIVGRLAVVEEPRVVVDMCAAPGGKTTHVAELLHGRGIVYSFDHSARKVKKLKEEVERLGLKKTVKIYRADSRYLDKDFPSLVSKADVVILDPPCSSIGVIPKVYDAKRYRDVESLASYQKQFVKTAVKLLKPCGLLVYSTCTVTVVENEGVVEYALGLGMDVVKPGLRHPKSSRGIGFSEAIRFHPHVHGLPGYFIAVLRKKC